MYTAEEQKEHRKQLVAALRSGNYQQTTKVLKDENGFCCLGVACDISGLGEWTASNRYKTPTKTEVCVLPPIVADWLGIDQAGRFINDGLKDALWVKNDMSRMTFNEIADIIESEPVWISDAS